MIYLLVKGFPRDVAHISHGAALMFSIMLCVSLYWQRKRNGVVRLLFWLVATEALLLTKEIVAQASGTGYDLGLAHLSTTIALCVLPLEMSFMFRIVAPRWMTPARIAFMFIPFVLLAVVNFFFRTWPVFLATVAFSSLFTGAGIYLIFIATSRYNRYIEENFSYTGNTGVTWVRGILIVFIFSYTIWVVEMMQDNWYVDAVSYWVDILTWGIIYRYSIRHKVIEDIPDMLLPGSSKPSVEAIPESAALEPHRVYLMNKICICFELEKLFLNPNLSIHDVATSVSSNRTYISKAINTEAGVTFYKFVNRYRIQHALSLINAPDNQKYTLEAIARQSGFNSMTTFYDFFRQEKGCTPREYLKKLNSRPNHE